MSAVVHGRVLEHLQRLRLGFVAERLDAVLAEAARREPTYLDFSTRSCARKSKPNSASASRWACRLRISLA
jgi:hypothetical protein